MTKPEPILWLNDARGVYIPRDFATSFADRSQQVSGVEDDAWEILEFGPEHELYWDAWQEVCDNAIVTDDKGVRYHVDQDGDCWLVPIGMEWSEDTETWQWPVSESPGCNDYAPDTLNPVEADRGICTNCFYQAIDHPRND